MSAPKFKLWLADPHEFGPGKLHIVLVGEDDRLFCGRARADVPGQWWSGVKADCQICLRAARKRFPELAARSAS